MRMWWGAESSCSSCWCSVGQCCDDGCVDVESGGVGGGGGGGVGGVGGVGGGGVGGGLFAGPLWKIDTL